MRRFLVVFLVLFAEVPVQASPWQPFTALGESADGRLLATGGLGGEVLCWEVSTGEVLKRWQLDDVPVAGVQWGPSGTVLAAVLADGRAFQLSKDSTEPQSLVLPGSPWTGLRSSAVAWKSQGSPMSGAQASFGGAQARGFPDGSLVVSGLPHLGEVTWMAHLSAVTGLAWSPDGRILTSCSFDGTLAQWDPQTGNLLSRL